MQILQVPEGISEPIPINHGRPLEPGKEYICTNAFTGVMLLSRRQVNVDGKPWSLRALLKSYSIEFAPFDPSEDWNGKDIWLYRGGGYGDLLMLTPLIRELKKRWPHAWIHVACGDQYSSVFDGMGVITEQLPIPYDKHTRIDALIEFEEIIEGNPRGREMHIAHLFADRAGIILSDIKPEYHVTSDEFDWACDNYPPCFENLPRVGIQFMASAVYRTYPKIGRVMLRLSKFAQVFLIGAPGQIQLNEEYPNIFNLMQDKLDFRHSASVISTCNVCVSSDSALVHLCSALGVPCVSLYGPFPSALRVSSALTYAFDGKAKCAPCFFHAESIDQFPTGMPCSDLHKCVALDSISVDDIVDKVKSLI